jgi:hypothetical protein
MGRADATRTPVPGTHRSSVPRDIRQSRKVLDGVKAVWGAGYGAPVDYKSPTIPKSDGALVRNTDFTATISGTLTGTANGLNSAALPAG